MRARLFILLLLLIPTCTLAQNYTTVTGNLVGDASNTGLLQSGTICFTPIAAGNQPTVFQRGGGGVALPKPVCRDVLTGVIQSTYLGQSLGALTVAASNHSSPLNVQYLMTVTDNSDTSSYTLGIAYITGSTWSLDSWTPTSITTLPTPGPSSISGNLSIYGSATSTGAITAPYFHGLSDSAITAQKWTTLRAGCPHGYSPSTQDISGNWLDCNANSYQASGTTPGMIAQAPAGSEMVSLLTGYYFNIGSASSYAQFDVNGHLYVPAITGPSGTATTVNGFQPLLANLAYPLSYQPRLQCFGDSITYGLELTIPGRSYCYWLGQAVNAVVNNYGVSGSVSGQQDALLYNNPQTYGHQSIVAELIGTNNVSYGDNANLEQMYGQNVMAQYAWSAIPPSQKLLFNSSSGITFTGTWNHSTAFGSNDPGRTCTGTSCAATFSGTGDVLYVVTGISNGNAATATLTCDGTDTGTTLYFAGVGGQAVTQVQTQLARASLSAGTHSCTIQSTNSTGNVNIEWAAFLDGSLPADHTTVLAGLIIQRNPTPDAVTPKYVAEQTSAINQLNSDGLVNVVTVDDQTAVTLVNQYNDGLHPGNYGQWQLSQPWVTALSVALNTPIAQPAYLPQPVTSFAGCAGQNTVAGFNALATCTSGEFDTAMGNGAGEALTTADQVSLFGWSSGSALTTGGANTFFGNQTGSKVTTGGDNTFVGATAGAQTGTGVSYETGLGFEALAYDGSATGAAANVAVGAFAMLGVNGSSTGTSNVAVGTDALYAYTTGANNTAIGNQALRYETTGTDITAIGSGAGSLNSVTGLTQDVFVGSLAKANTSGISGAGAIGHNAQVNANGAWQLGAGVNSTANTLQFMGWNLVDSTGDVNTATVLGPATAPTGSCSTNGAWVFSQDGHATFCASGTWTTKI